ncbi:YjcQ family protein [Lacticaseibacillus pabuli]|uniref:YjcQ family protein n=1 Tax=Lacticaseibacillus pabuli TaxID=3025672 RepID=A0ABY7WU32_9LACO|nr:YjcQ family protein [Lacticaseibacillus sp. KACC 23028]WDF83626.1 YjcQ family protein [Lacticaseibacillus sp. KACC 23028]
MAKDDYFVVIYQLLRVLYNALKSGKQLTDEEFEGQLVTLNERYWNYIVQNMADDGYITGVFKVHPAIAIGETSGVKYHNVAITPKGIEYLFSNNMKERVKNTLKDIKEIIPGM